MVFEKDDGWYFLNETEQLHGPYESYIDANQDLARYEFWLEYGFSLTEAECYLLIAGGYRRFTGCDLKGMAIYYAQIAGTRNY